MQKTTTIRINVSTKHKIKVEAAKRGVTMTSLINTLIEKAEKESDHKRPLCTLDRLTSI